MEPKLNIIYLKLDEVVPNPWNPNVQSEFMFEKNKRSMEKNGQVLPILVRKKGDSYEIIDGEHRWKSAKHLNWSEIAANDLGEMSDAKAKVLGQVINRVGGEDDPARLRDLYTGLLDEVSREKLLEDLPTTELQFEEAIKDISTDWMDMPSDSRKQKGERPPEDFVYLKLSLPKELKEQFESQLKRFKMLIYPDQDPKDVSPVMPFEAMLQVLAQTPDEHIMGAEL